MSRRNLTALSPPACLHPRPTKLYRVTWYENCMIISHLFVAVISLNKWSVWFSGYVPVPGKAEGHAAVPVCWRPQAQREREGRESRGGPAAKLRAVFKTGQGKAEPNGEPSVTLAKVCLLSLLLSNLKLYKKLKNRYYFVRGVYLNLLIILSVSGMKRIGPPCSHAWRDVNPYPALTLSSSRLTN